MKTTNTPPALICLLLAGIFSENSYALTHVLKIKIARNSYSDEIAIRFMQGATTGFDGCCDAWKLFSFNSAVPNLFTKTDNGNELAINALPSLTTSYSVALFVRTGASATYSISPTAVDSFPANIGITLKDNVTGTIYDLTTGNTYTIALPVISVSAAARFSVDFTFPVLLPIALTNFSAHAEKDNVLLKWSTATEENNDYFTVERAEGNDGRMGSWNVAGMVQGAGNSSIIRSYEFTDTDFPSYCSLPVAPYYYRLRQTDFNGNYKYFGPISVSVENTPSEINVYPNPTSGKFTVYGLRFIPMNIGSNNYALEIYDISGEKIFNQTIDRKQETVNLNVPNGIYFLNVKTENESFTKKIVITN